jgi:SAM-dependent methyltransferase
MNGISFTTRMISLLIDPWQMRPKNWGRQSCLFVHEGGRNKLKDKCILHFAPEACAELIVRDCKTYKSADLYQKGVDLKTDITAINQPDESYDVVICSNVLEHIPDDAKALREIRRVLKPGGTTILMVPICDGCDHTYEDPNITDPKDQVLHFGQWDHVRY